MPLSTVRSSLFAALIALVGVVSGGSSSFAQGDIAPNATYPAFMFAGNCHTPGTGPRFPLATAAVARVPASASVADPAPPPAVLDVALAEFLAKPHAIAVRADGDEAAPILACGDVRGATTAGGEELVIGLEERDGSGYAGVARLVGEGERTHVATFLAEGLFGTASGPAQPPTSVLACGCGPSGNLDAKSATVTIVDFLFLPSAIEIKAGTTVTWINEGPGDHAVSVFRDGKLIMDSGILAAGRSFARRFGEPGVYEYLSPLDPTMRARIVVVPAAEEGVAA